MIFSSVNLPSFNMYPLFFLY
uniref:Uncharacterized protein n=1 Tax=Anguilla anguilla TaxID=7936 RepID=A0A0E9Q0N8_ANGAN